MSDLQRILWQRLNADASRALGHDWTRKKIILYGAGGLGASFLQTFPQISVSYFVDSDAGRVGSEFNGLTVHSPEQLRLEEPEEIVVFITSSWHEEIRLTLQSLGLVLNQHFYYGTQKAHGRIFFYLPQMSDFEKAFSWFDQNGASYAILRWFDSLPTEIPEDIHILFETEDLELLFKNPYLTSEPEGVQLEIYWTQPLGQEDELLTYPTWLAHEILNSRTKGPKGAFVPSPATYLKSLAYHVVFHKAEKAELPAAAEAKGHTPPNKYSRQLFKLAATLEVPLTITLEGLWDYLDSVGWLPPVDLARRYASDLESPWLCTKVGSVTGAEEDVLVFVFREWLTERSEILDVVVHEIERFGLERVAIIEFNHDEKKRAYEQIRGGNWIESEGSRIGGGPAALGVFRDLNPEVPSEQDRLLRPFCRNQKLTLKTELKQRICKEFNSGELVNFLHAADDMREGYEYVDCLDAVRCDAVHVAIEKGSK